MLDALAMAIGYGVLFIAAVPLLGGVWLLAFAAADIMRQRVAARIKQRRSARDA